MLPELQLEAAAGGRFEGLLGVVAEVVEPQPATGTVLSISRDWSRSGIKSCNPKNQIWDLSRN